MKIVIVTQEEPFYIPVLLRGFLRRVGQVDGIILLPDLPHGFTRFSYIKRLFDVFGIQDFTKFGFLYLHHKVADVIGTLIKSNRHYSVNSIAKMSAIPLLRVNSINSEDSIEILKKLKPDILISIASPQIFKRDIIHSADHTINIHAALLPHNKGMMPSFWALAKGEKKTGITVHYVDDYIDTGDILLQRSFEIGSNATLHSLQIKVAEFGADALVEVVSMLERGSPKVTKPHGEGIYHSFPTKAAAQELRTRGRRFI